MGITKNQTENGPDPAEATLLPTRSADSRRDFIRGSSLLLAGAIPGGRGGDAQRPVAYPAGLRIGLLGCGYRGQTAIGQFLRNSNGRVKLVAVADAFPDRLQQAIRSLRGRFGTSVEVESGCRHLGLTAYQHLLQSNIDLVVLATPPGFMPLHFEAAVLAGKHVFMEAPVATDSAGIQRVVASGQRASDLGLVVATSWDGSNDSPLQRALEAARSGQLGQIQFARICSTVDACPGTEGSNSQKAYAQPRKVQRREGQSELEYQIRNWRDFLWSGGDNLVHQQARYLLACNDLLEAHPIEAHRWATAAANATNIGPPGQVGDAIEGQQVELTYANGVRLICETRRVGGARRGIHATLHGSRAWCDLTTGKVFDRENRAIGQPAHANWQPVNPVESQLAQLLENGSSPSSGVASVQRVAEATMTAILGRDAGWAGRSLTYDECLHSLHRVFDMDAIMHLSNSPPANSPLPQAI